MPDRSGGPTLPRRIRPVNFFPPDEFQLPFLRVRNLKVLLEAASEILRAFVTAA